MAMRLGIVLYIVPFVFVIKPALIFNGPLIETFQHFLTFLLGIYMLTSALEGYWRGIDLSPKKFLILRIGIVFTGALLIVPEIYTDISGIVCFVTLGGGSIYHRKHISK